MFRQTFVAALALGAPVLAQTGPSFDCGQANSSAEQLICSDTELAALDQRVADRFAAALAAIKEFGSGAQEAEDTLRAYQRGWIKGRDECWKAEDLRACIQDEYLRREAQLVAQFMLETPSSVTSWQCAGNPANEVVTFFFDTPLPGVRIERGDSIGTGTLVESASGAKYAAAFGQSIWVNGDTALYREADPDGTELECSAVK